MNADDEREALARILDDNDPEGGVTPDPEGGTWEWWLPQVDAILAAGFRRQGPITDEWEEHIQYGRVLDGIGWWFEPKGKNYATHQRTVKLGPPKPVEAARDTP